MVGTIQESNGHTLAENMRLKMASEPNAAPNSHQKEKFNMRLLYHCSSDSELTLIVESGLSPLL